MGRHTSASRLKAHRRAAALKLTGATIMICLIVAALYSALATHRSVSASPPAKPPPAALMIEVTGAECPVFVRRPGGEVLVNETLTRGQSVHFDGPRFDVVIGDAGAVRVYVNGRIRSVGQPGGQATFTAP